MIRLRQLLNTILISMAVFMSGCGATPEESEGNTTKTREALTNGDAGFVWSSLLSSSGNASSSYSFNSSGGTNYIAWLSTGQYRIDFPGIGSTIGGDVQVTAYGSGSERCKVNSWGSSGSTLQVYVGCYNTSGALTNSLFTANYVRRTGTPGQEGAYLWAYSPSSSSYTVTGSYQWNSTGGAITITHTPGTGTYSVNLGGQSLSGGTVEVTAYGGGRNSYCKVGSWGGSTATVLCFDGTTGAAVESYFDLIFSTKSPNNIPSWTYLWANQPTTSSYNPSPTYELGNLNSECGVQITEPNATITRSAVGSYNIKFSGMASVSMFPSNVKVTGYGYASDTCKIVNWYSSGADAYANIACFNSAGVRVDAYYTVTFSSFAYTIC